MPDGRAHAQADLYPKDVAARARLKPEQAAREVVQDAVLLYVHPETALRALRDPAVGAQREESREHRTQLAVDPSPRRPVGCLIPRLEQHRVLVAPGARTIAGELQRRPVHFESEDTRRLLGVPAEPHAEERSPALERAGD